VHCLAVRHCAQRTWALRRQHAERRALTRLRVEVPTLEPDEVVRIAELAGLDELRGALAG
jgi:hypothetical protein